MTRVLVLGGVAYNTIIYLDRFPDPRPHTVFSRGAQETAGSTGAGKALNLAPLGLDVTLHGLIGDDENGRKLRRLFTQSGITFLADVDPQGTQRHVNLMDKDGRRISIYVNAGAFEPVVDWARLEPHIAAADVIALNIINYCRHAIPRLQAHSKPIWVDLHDYDGQEAYHHDFLAAADVLFLSSERLPDYRAFMQQQIAAGKTAVVVTHGRDGATALTGDDRFYHQPILPAYAAAMRDTNGAGDAFFAGALHAYTKGFPVEKWLQWGTIVAGMCVTATDLAHPHLSEAAVAAAHREFYGNP